MQRQRHAIFAAVAALLAWALGPGLPATCTELASAFSGRGVLVCGASYGIGADIAYGLARSGARLALVARSEDKLRAVARRCLYLGAAEVHVVEADLSSRDGSRHVMEKAVALLDSGGGMDVLVLNHIMGIYDDWPARLLQHSCSSALEADLELVERMFRINILSYIDLSSYALRYLTESKSGGRILAVGSATGKMGMPRVAPYAATKSAMFGYFESLRQDLLASKDPALRSVRVTTGVLGSFSTDNAVKITAGKIANGVVFSDPALAAHDLLKGLARGWNTVYTPWHQVRLAALLHSIMPETMDWVLRKMTVPS